MKNKKLALAIFIVPLVLIIVLNRKDVTLSSQKDMKLGSLTGGYILQSTLVLNNPNLLSSTIKNIHEKFYINGVLVGILDNEVNQGIAGRQESQFPLNIRFPASVLSYIPAPKNAADTMLTVKTEGEVDYQNLTGQGKIIIGSSTQVSFSR